MRLPFVLCSIASLVLASFSGAGVLAQEPAAACRRWQECRTLALEARSRGEFQHFYDLAWRAVQTGPRDDAELMYLLARAQSLNGRPRDALVILGRLLDRGIVVDARTEPDLDRARRLPAWPELEARMKPTPSPLSSPAIAPAAPPLAAPAAPSLAAAAPSPVTAAAGPPPVATAAAPVSAPAAPPVIAAATPAFRPVGPTPPDVRPAPIPGTAALGAATLGALTAVPPAPALRFDLRGVDEVSRFAGPPFTARGLAWDPASRRFVLADPQGRRLIVVGEGSDHADDLVRAGSAGFADLAAFSIDERRGDLWVVSADDVRGVSTLHRLQLISGRTLVAFETPAAIGRTRVVDAGVTPAGMVVMLDAAASRLLVLRGGAGALEELVRIDADDPSALAIGDERTAYVAHRAGIDRVDLARRTSVRVSEPRGVPLTRFTHLRWHRDALVGVQRQPDGTFHVLRLRVSRSGAVPEAVVLALNDPASSPVGVSVSGDEMHYLVAEAQTAAGSGRPGLRLSVRRLTLPAP